MMQLPQIQGLMDGALPPCYEFHQTERKQIVSLKQSLAGLNDELEAKKAMVNHLQREIDAARLMNQQIGARNKQALIDLQQQMKAEYDEKIEMMKQASTTQLDELNRKIAKLEESNTSLTFELQQIKGMAALKKFEERGNQIKHPPKDTESEKKEKQMMAELVSSRIQITEMYNRIVKLESQLQNISEIHGTNEGIASGPPTSFRSISVQTTFAVTEPRKSPAARPPSPARIDPSTIRSLQAEIREKEALIGTLRGRIDGLQKELSAGRGHRGNVKVLHFPPTSSTNLQRR